MPNSAQSSSVSGPRILLCGWAGSGNIGDELLTRAMVEVLDAAGARVVVASRDPSATVALHPTVDAVPWGARGLRQMGDIDGVCVGPGGILQDASSLWSLPGHLVMPWRARRQGAAVAAIGVGAEQLKRRSSAAMLRRVLADAPIVTRDSPSSAALAAAGLRSATSIDVVFGLTLPEVERQDEIVVAVGPSSRPGRLAPAARQLVAAPVNEIARAVDALAERLESRVVFTCFRGRRDAAAALEVAAKIDADHEIFEGDVDEHVRRVSGARIVLSSRYHPIVVAAASGTPVLAVSEQPKVVSLVAQVDNPLVVRCASWDAVARSNSAPQPGPPSIPHGLAIAQYALHELVRAARESRGDQRGG